MKKTLAVLTLLSSIILLPAAYARADDAPTTPTTPAPAARRQGEVNHRLRRQRRRINQGVKSGQLTHGEAKELREHDKAIHAEEREDRKENGGKLTPADKQQLNKELNQNSKDIYQEKHDGETR